MPIQESMVQFHSHFFSLLHPSGNIPALNLHVKRHFKTLKEMPFPCPVRMQGPFPPQPTAPRLLLLLLQYQRTT